MLTVVEREGPAGILVIADGPRFAVTKRRPMLPALTGLRTFSALNIVFFHFSDPKWFGWFEPIVVNGYVGVDFFFLLSGFILMYNYGDRAAQGMLDARSFWRTRFYRIYPVYLLGLLVSLPVLWLEWQGQSRPMFFAGLVLTPAMLQGWHPILSTFWNTPAWTLSCEVFFYALFPVMAGKRWLRSEAAARLMGYLAGLWALALVLPALYTWLRPDGLAAIDRYRYGFWLRAVKFMPLPHLPVFVAGMVLARLNDSLKVSSRQRLMMAVAAGAAVIAVLHTGAALPFLLAHNGLLVPIFGLGILGLAGEHLVATALGWKPLVRIGEASYCLYILHFNLWELLHRFYAWAPVSGIRIERFDPLLSYVLLVVAALAAYRWVEVPGRGWMKRIFERSV